MVHGAWVGQLAPDMPRLHGGRAQLQGLRCAALRGCVVMRVLLRACIHALLLHAPQPLRAGMGDGTNWRLTVRVPDGLGKSMSLGRWLRGNGFSWLAPKPERPGGPSPPPAPVLPSPKRPDGPAAAPLLQQPTRRPAPVQPRARVGTDSVGGGGVHPPPPSRSARPAAQAALPANGHAPTQPVPLPKQALRPGVGQADPARPRMGPPGRPRCGAPASGGWADDNEGDGGSPMVGPRAASGRQLNSNRTSAAPAQADDMKLAAGRSCQQEQHHAHAGGGAPWWCPCVGECVWVWGGRGRRGGEIGEGGGGREGLRGGGGWRWEGGKLRWG